MQSGCGVRLIWDNKGDNNAAKQSFTIDSERLYPHPLFHSDMLFGEPIDTDLTRCRNAVNRMIQGDNLMALEHLLEQGYRDKIDLIYIDPPYLSQSNYISRIMLGTKGHKEPLERLAFRDREKFIDCYLNDLYLRLRLMKELLAPNGSIFVHLDWHVSHYVKVLLDEIFSSDSFINEIVWCYGGGSGSKRHFHRKHDLILWYSRGEDYIFNPQYRPYSEGTLSRGLTKVKGNKYSLHTEGALLQDWWIDINKILSPTAYENLKYPTQKPAALLKRIIAAASNPGSLVADFYAGSGTTAEVCEEMNRAWIICDNSELALQTSRHRLIRSSSKPFKVEKIISINDTKKEAGNLVLTRPIIRKYDDKLVSLCIGIKSYNPSEDNTLPANTHVPFSSLIDFWEVDLDYRSTGFNSDIQVLRKKIGFDQSINLDITILVPAKSAYSIAVRVYDVYGKNVIKLLDLAEK